MTDTAPTRAADWTTTPTMPEDLPPVNLTENARQVLVRRYVRRGSNG